MSCGAFVVLGRDIEQSPRTVKPVRAICQEGVDAIPDAPEAFLVADGYFHVGSPN
jgi:hypothetical protein